MNLYRFRVNALTAARVIAMLTRERTGQPIVARAVTDLIAYLRDGVSPRQRIDCRIYADHRGAHSVVREI